MFDRIIQFFFPRPAPEPTLEQLYADFPSVYPEDIDEDALSEHYRELWNNWNH